MRQATLNRTEPGLFKGQVANELPRGNDAFAEICRELLDVIHVVA
jgi:hypothetical protein